MTSRNQGPEQKARDRIDHLLTDAGWIVQPKTSINLGAGLGVAIREYQTAAGPVDYALFVNRVPVGVIEAKREEEGARLTVVETQSGEYADSKLKYLNNEPLPFVYESTGVLTRFTDRRDPKPRSRPVFSFARPETFQAWLRQDKPLRGRLQDLPVLETDGLRRCQVGAITNLEASFGAARPRALVQMATGSGKTFTAITAIYRLLKYARARRVLFLVDTKNLGEQAEQAFQAYTPNDDNRKFTELYNVQRLTSRHISSDAQVCISTIQRLYSILKGEGLDSAAEETNPNELVQPKAPMPVVYNASVPIEFFDFIVIDECHRSIYNVWKQVLDYFDAFLIGLTATPDKRTFAFFNENVVSEYTYEEAITDGVNVDHQIYVIETERTQQGGYLSAQEYVDRRDKLTRRKRWAQLDEDLSYTGKQLDRAVVNPSQIRNVVRAFRSKLPEMFPGRAEVPKTLVFAKSDSHADDVIQMIREEFGESNEFCKKVTYKSVEDPKSVLGQFRNDYSPRIAVTVDMIATGTDVKPIECLLFMRDVKSVNYFEQMKGRATRTLGFDDLRKVTPSAGSAKTHFVIVDAVGATKTKKTDSRPLERQKSVPIKDLMMGVMMGAQDEDAFLSLASRLSRINQQLSEAEKGRLAGLTGGLGAGEMARMLLRAHDPDEIEAKAVAQTGLSVAQMGAEPLAAAKEVLMRAAASVFTGEVIDYLDNVRREHEQIIDEVNLDRVTAAGWDVQAREQREALVRGFAEFIEANKDEIGALRIFYNLPVPQRAVTLEMVRGVLAALRAQRPGVAPLAVWQAYERLEEAKGGRPVNELTALVGLIRRVAGLDEVLTTHRYAVDRNFQRWVFEKQVGAGPKFSEAQMAWLRMIKEHVVSSFHIEVGDLEYAPFDGQGGLAEMYGLFGEEMDGILEEMNEALVA